MVLGPPVAVGWILRDSVRGFSHANFHSSTPIPLAAHGTPDLCTVRSGLCGLCGPQDWVHSAEVTRRRRGRNRMGSWTVVGPVGCGGMFGVSV